VRKRVLTRHAVDVCGGEEGIDVHVMERVLIKGWGRPEALWIQNPTVW
jgi:hypothetical protein